VDRILYVVVAGFFGALLGTLVAGGLLLLVAEKRLDPHAQVARYWKQIANVDVECKPHAQLPQLVGSICMLAEQNGVPNAPPAD
jgi:hypothetical protein